MSALYKILLNYPHLFLPNINVLLCFYVRQCWSLNSRFDVSELQNQSNTLTHPSARVTRGTILWSSWCLVSCKYWSLRRVMDMGLLWWLKFGCCGKTVRVCHVCCEVGTFIVFFFLFFLIIRVTCTWDSSVLDHVTQRRACVLKVDTLGWIIFNNNAADHNLRQWSHMIYPNVVTLSLDKIYIWH